MPAVVVKKFPLLKVLLIVWLAFTSVYFVYGEYSRVKLYVAQASYSKGIQDSIVQLAAEATKCQPIPIQANGQRFDLIALSCLNPPAQTEESAGE